MGDEYQRLANRQAEAGASDNYLESEHARLRAVEAARREQDKRGLAGEEPDAILTASDSAVDAELRRLGVDPVAVGERGEAFVEATTLYEAAFKSMRPVDFGSAKARHAIVPRLAEALRGRDVEIRALRDMATAFVETVERAEAARETKGGQHVPYHDDFASVFPSTASELRRWAKGFRAALAKVRP